MVSESEKNHLDDVLLKFGSLGSYQIRMILLLGFAFFLNAMHCVGFIFIAEDVPYRDYHTFCSITTCIFFKIDTFLYLLFIGIPGCKIEQCERQDKVFESPWFNFTAPGYRTCYKYETVNSSECTPINFNASILESCTDWVYSDDKSFVSEFQLACQDWKRTFVGTVHSIGLMIGLCIQGQLSDKIGRKGAIIIAGLCAAIFGLAKSFATSYLVFITLELLESIFGDNCSPAFIMSVELVASDFRLQQQLFLSFVYSWGGVTLAIAAYCLPYWKHFVRAIYMPSFLFILYYFIMPESARWLLSRGKKEKATKVLLKIAKINGVKLEEKMLEGIQCEDETKISPLRDTFRSKIVVRRLIVCLIWWMSCTFICFGLAVNVVSLAGNKYVNFGLMSLSDMPAAFAMVYTLKKFKRRKPLLSSYIIAGILCVVQPFVPGEYMWISTALYMSGRFISIFTFTIVYIYTSELFPTYTRNSLHALCSAIGRTGSILAPMIPLLTPYMDPMFLIGGISIFAGLATFLMPDVDNDALPDNVKQAERIGMNSIEINNVQKEKIINKNN